MSVAWSSVARAHAVQFYDDEAFLYRATVGFFAEGLRNGEPLVLLTQRHTFEGVAALLASGIDGPPVDAAKRVLFLDADEVLAYIVVDGLPDPDRLREAAIPVLRSLRQGRDDITVWIAGNTSALLCRAGNYAGAQALEQLWNDLADEMAPLSTLCFYAMSDFDGEAQASCFQTICSRHAHVYPAEGYSDALDDRSRLEEVALLQHRVRVLDRPTPTQRPAPDDHSATSTLYVIDDDVSVRRGLTRLLAAVRQPAQIFDSAEAFLAEVRPDADGCLLVDVQLAGMSGTDLQRRMASEQRRMPVIAMSGLHDADIEAEALELGASTFLRKPFDAQTLLTAIDHARTSRK
jgi:CheY-like chemotaxis protein